MSNATTTMAHLYVWAAITDILEGSASPDREDATAAKKVQRVLEIARQEQQRLLAKHDAAIGREDAPPIDNGTPTFAGGDL